MGFDTFDAPILVTHSTTLIHVRVDRMAHFYRSWSNALIVQSIHTLYPLNEEFCPGPRNRVGSLTGQEREINQNNDTMIVSQITHCRKVLTLPLIHGSFSQDTSA